MLTACPCPLPATGERRGAGGRVWAQGPRRGGHPGRALQGGQGGQRVPAGPLQGQEGETQVVNARRGLTTPIKSLVFKEFRAAYLVQEKGEDTKILN